MNVDVSPKVSICMTLKRQYRFRIEYVDAVSTLLNALQWRSSSRP